MLSKLNLKSNYSRKWWQTWTFKLLHADIVFSSASWNSVSSLRLIDSSFSSRRRHDASKVAFAIERLAMCYRSEIADNIHVCRDTLVVEIWEWRELNAQQKATINPRPQDLYHVYNHTSSLFEPRMLQFSYHVTTAWHDLSWVLPACEWLLSASGGKSRNSFASSQVTGILYGTSEIVRSPLSAHQTSDRAPLSNPGTPMAWSNGTIYSFRDDQDSCNQLSICLSAWVVWMCKGSSLVIWDLTLSENLSWHKARIPWSDPGSRGHHCSTA